jgi:hypothetical protein
MPRSVRCALVLALVFGVSSCVSDKMGGAATGGSGGGAGGGGGQSGAAGTAGSADAGNAPSPDAMMGPPASCRDVRVCIHNCGQDKACADKCVSTAPAKIRQQYQEILTCSMAACPGQDEPCRCDQECFNDGQCFELVDACDEAVSDPWCDVRCH